jgi:cell division protein FtsI (penicillin-binding protein 3)
MLDSPRGAHHGGDVAAPVFGRVAQQILAYMNVPHDADVKNSQRLWIRANAKPEDMSEGSPDNLSEQADWAGEDVAATETAVPLPVAASLPTAKETARAKLIAASFTPAPQPKMVAPPPPALKPIESTVAARGTVILDAEGARSAPSLLGKTVRSAVIAAQDAGVELDVIGSGVAREQSPAPGEPLGPGARITVRFSR